MSLTVHIITPQRAWDPCPADHITLPAHDGEIGIRPRHAAMLCLLGEGTLHIKQKSQANIAYACRGGIAQIQNDEIHILAENIAEVGEIGEQSLARRIVELRKTQTDDPIEASKTTAEIHWLETQLKTAGKDIP